MSYKRPVPDGQLVRALDRSTSLPPHRVAIYVSDHCTICAYAHEIADLIRKRFPDVELRVIDLSDPGETVPESVFATPTYLLNGQVWSLGNPSPQQVIDTLSKLE